MDAATRHSSEDRNERSIYTQSSTSRDEDCISPPATTVTTHASNRSRNEKIMILRYIERQSKLRTHREKKSSVRTSMGISILSLQTFAAPGSPSVSTTKTLERAQKTQQTIVELDDLAPRFLSVRFPNLAEGEYWIGFCEGTKCHLQCQSSDKASCRKPECHSNCLAENTHEGSQFVDLQMRLRSPQLLACHITRGDSDVDLEGLSKYLENDSECAAVDTNVRQKWSRQDGDMQKRLFTQAAAAIKDDFCLSAWLFDTLRNE